MDINRISGLAQTTAGTAVNQTGKAAGGFADLLYETLEEVNAKQIASDQAVQELHGGKAQSLHEVMIAMEEAEISLRYMVQMRNKMLDAYNEIMRLQI